MTAVSVPLAAQTVSVRNSDRNPTDTLPLLRRIFNDFPTLYTDTTYRDTSFRVVIRATLFNNNWHRHHSETTILPPSEKNKGDSVRENRKRKPPMVIFIKKKI